MNPNDVLQWIEIALCDDYARQWTWCAHDKKTFLKPIHKEAERAEAKLLKSKVYEPKTRNYCESCRSILEAG